ncbi:disulfide bond formation protein B [Hyphomicrobium methylovorum]|nr:disulfide bond formation protein B [Hyphomicrobium methylovorum]
MGPGGTMGRGSDYRFGAAALFITTGVILAALGFQYIGGYVPCMLCLWERYAYYLAIPLLFIALALTSGGNRGVAAALFYVVALAFLANAILAGYHAGAEWKFWPGPAACGGGESLTTSAGNLLNDLQSIRVMRCDEASLRVAGLSFAGWNVVVSLFLALLCWRAGAEAVRQRRAG